MSPEHYEKVRLPGFSHKALAWPRKKISTLHPLWQVLQELVEDAVGIRTYGDEKIASVITAIRVLSELSVANSSRSRWENIITEAPENPGNGLVNLLPKSERNNMSAEQLKRWILDHSYDNCLKPFKYKVNKQFHECKYERFVNGQKLCFYILLQWIKAHYG